MLWQLERVTLLAIPFFIIAMIIEWLSVRRQNPNNYTATDSAANITLGFAFLFLQILIATTLFAIFSFVYRYRLFDIPHTWSALIAGDGSFHGWAFLALFLAEDFCFYVFHRVSHTSRFYWAIHENHHSSDHFNFSVALRQPPLEALTAWIFWLPLPLLGFAPEDIVFQMAVNLFVQFWMHTLYTKRIPVLEWIFNTPSHHRVHHATNLDYLDKNYAGTFIIWDRLFGSFTSETHPPKYGILHPIGSDNPLIIFTHDFKNLLNDMRSATRLRDKLAYLIKPPGWRHDGTGLTVSQMRKNAS
jgi:sterol desaturase/sphingolipid hydroxylase (fatty acid hydroxylase superfamily)